MYCLYSLNKEPSAGLMYGRAWSMQRFFLKSLKSHTLMILQTFWLSSQSQVKCIYKAHFKTTHAVQSAVQLNHNKISKQIEKQKKNN